MNSIHSFRIASQLYSLIIVSVLLLAGNHHSLAQAPVDSASIVVTYNKTTSIIFRSSIKSVDRGSRDVLAQKASGIENILHVKAARQYFPETNLTVITEDSILHQIAVNYAKDPSVLVYNIAMSDKNRFATFDSKLTSYQLDRYALSILPSHQFSLWRCKDKTGKAKLQLQSIHIRSDVLFFHIAVKNQSSISYTVNYIRLFVRDRVQPQRTASQENTVVPIMSKGNVNETLAGQTEHIIYATDKFTIPHSKRLYIEVYESNGGRNLKLKINNRKIIRALPVQ
jgi:conjugative transposon TraN protein